MTPREYAKFQKSVMTSINRIANNKGYYVSYEKVCMEPNYDFEEGVRLSLQLDMFKQKGD